MLQPDDAFCMQQALQQAQTAAALGEVPVGAVLVAADGRTVLGRGHNRCIAAHDPSAHAEMLALREAAQQAGNYRLEGSTLYVTLEPCAMCAGAMLHARLARVVYAVADSKTGAAGSVLNVFAQPFNHQTVVQPLADADVAAQCAALLQGFFQSRRVQARSAWPLRDDALRTPEACFSSLPDAQEPGCYVNDLPALDGLRLHYQDVASASGGTDAPVLLCLHDKGQWSHAFAHTARAASVAGWRVLTPDMVGFGRSDKPKKPVWHSHARHVQILQELVLRLDVQRLAWLGQGWGAQLGRDVQQAMPQRFVPAPQDASGWMQQDRSATSDPEHPAWRAPFPDAGHEAALRAMQS